MRLGSISRAAAALVAASLAGCGRSDPPSDQGDGTREATSLAQGMTVSGNQLLRDGEPFRPRGFNMIGVLTPAWCSNGSGVKARQHFGATELDSAIQSWHANTVRFQVSQRGLGDSSRTPAEIAAYLQQVESSVALARSLGLVVILSMQDQGIGCGGVHPLPSAQTVAAWRELVPAFANSPYVMFELFNEPENDTSDAQWAQWRNGGTTPLANLGDPAVGLQTLLGDIRGLGANNVLIADGAKFAEHLDNITNYLLSDTQAGHGIAYAIHPYYFSPGASYWQSSYGFLLPSHAIVATEWNYQADKCGTSSETIAPSFLTWLEQHGIGVTGHAFDALDTLVADWSWTPTDCATANGGSGKVLQSWFQHLAQAPSAPGSLAVTATTTSLAASWSASSGPFAIAGYDVSLDGADTLTTTQLSASLTGLACGTGYTVGVGAIDVLGNRSALTTRTVQTASCLRITSLSAAPQPLVSSTTISFGLSEAAQVDLVIKNAAGAIVKHRLTHQSEPAGASSVSYYGYDDANKRLPAGNYTVVVTATDASGQTASASIALKIG